MAICALQKDILSVKICCSNYEIFQVIIEIETHL